MFNHFLTPGSTLQLATLPCLKLEHKNAVIPGPGTRLGASRFSLGSRASRSL